MKKRMTVMLSLCLSLLLLLSDCASGGSTAKNAEKAAAALTALTQDSRELSVQYRDNGDGQAVPYWNAT